MRKRDFSARHGTLAVATGATRRHGFRILAGDPQRI
jgi:hypothetical protein